MRIIIIILASALLFLNCEKDREYSSIIGEWLVEETGEISGYHRYNVSIQRLQTDTALYKISNFYRTGIATELIVEVDGVSLFIRGQSIGNYYVEGSGIVSADYKELSIEYQVNGQIYEEVMSSYIRK